VEHGDLKIKIIPDSRIPEFRIPEIIPDSGIPEFGIRVVGIIGNWPIFENKIDYGFESSKNIFEICFENWQIWKIL